MISRFRAASQRVWTRVLIIFIICLFPLLTLQIVIQRRGSSLILDQVYGSAFANVSYLSAHFDSNIKTLHNTAEYLLSVDDVRKFLVYRSTYSTAEYYAKADDVLGFLYQMSQSNPLIAEIRLYYPRSSLMLRAARTGKSYLQTFDGDIHERVRAASTSLSLLIEDGGEYRVSSMLGTLSDAQLPALYLEIILDNQEMSKRLSSFTASGEKLSFLYSHLTDALLFSDSSYQTAENARRFGDVLHEEQTDIEPYVVECMLDQAEYLLVAAYVPTIRCSLGQLILASDLEFIPHALQIGIYIFVGAFFLVLVILFVLMWLQIDRPTRRLLAAFDATGEGYFNTRIRECTDRWPLEYQLLSQHFNEMNQHTEQLIVEIYEQQLSLRQAQLKQLQAQINPHFLYNSFFLLRSLVISDEREQADQFLVCLGRYFQYITHNVSEDATLQEEYEHAQSYLSIQLMRFEDRLQVEIPPLPEHLKRLRVPRLMLQPLYENILVHGVWQDREVRRIYLMMEETQTEVRLAIGDNGRGVTPELLSSVRAKLTSHIPAEFTSGLTNIHHRLSLLGRGGCLEVGQSSLGGFLVIIHIPKE